MRSNNRCKISTCKRAIGSMQRPNALWIWGSSSRSASWSSRRFDRASRFCTRRGFLTWSVSFRIWSSGTKNGNSCWRRLSKSWWSLRKSQALKIIKAFRFWRSKLILFAIFARDLAKRWWFMLFSLEIMKKKKLIFCFMNSGCPFTNSSSKDFILNKWKNLWKSEKDKERSKSTQLKFWQN